MRLTFLTPNLPGLVCGLADHSWLLGEALVRKGCDVSLIGRHGDPAAARNAGWSGYAAVWDGTPSGLGRLLERIPADWLWVQLSGYGYSRWGAPWRLACALKAAQHRHPALLLAICVHEIHCEPHQLGRKGQVLSLWQRFTIAYIVRLGDLVLPTIPLWEQCCLKDYGVHPSRVQLLPIAANVPPVRLTVHQRNQWRKELGIGPSDQVAVAFGRWASQRTVFERLGPVVRNAIIDGNLDYVLTVGGESRAQPSWVKELLMEAPWARRLMVLGPQPARRVAEILAVADVGLVPTPWSLWGKSGAARALEQARLTLWIFDKDGHRVVPSNPNPPTWEILADAVVGWLRTSA
jgi:hypothetical protein